MTEFEDVVTKQWDIVIVGTGMGGATLGYQVAKKGLNVLFIEKGIVHLKNKMTLYDNFAETFLPETNKSYSDLKTIYARSGRWSDYFYVASKNKKKAFIPFVGAGSGGSSALYGAAMERFCPEDFTPESYADDMADSTLPSQWPISYNKLEPYYKKAEELYRIHGSPDPLKRQLLFKYFPPEKMCRSSKKLFDLFIAKGLSPYRLPIAYDKVDGCLGCQGFLCEKRCKNDSSKICLVPAIEKYGAKIIDECEVLKLDGNKETINKLVCIKAGKQFSIQAKQIVLSAGAIMSPLILLNSKNDFWPEGIGNRSGWVGKNLMRHHIDLYALFPKSEDLPGNRKEIAFNDYYFSDEGKLGTVQSFGALPPSDVLVDEMALDIANTFSKSVSSIFSFFKPLTSTILNHLFSKSLILASIKEDLPYAQNRVQLVKKAGMNCLTPELTYHISEYEQKRINKFRKILKNTFKPYRFLLLKQAENIERIAHACGTCRFGEDPATSVLSPQNKVHGTLNLFIVDSSFFPSSGGTNPSLTIAANALRIADHIV